MASTLSQFSDMSNDMPIERRRELADQEVTLNGVRAKVCATRSLAPTSTMTPRSPRTTCCTPVSPSAAPSSLMIGAPFQPARPRRPAFPWQVTVRRGALVEHHTFRTRDEAERFVAQLEETNRVQL